MTKKSRNGLSFSLERFGYVEPIIWNEKSGNVVGGHQRLNFLRSKGLENIDVVVVDLDEANEKALNLTLNNPEIEGEFTDFANDLLDAIKSEMPNDFGELLLEELKLDIEKSSDFNDDLTEGIIISEDEFI